MSKKTVMMILRFMMLGGIIFTIIFYSARIFAHCEEPSLGASSGGSSSDNNYYFFATPLPVKPDVGSDVLTSQIIETIVDDLESGNYTGYPYNEHGFGVDEINCIIFREYNSSGNYVTFYAYKDLYIDSFTFPSDYNSNSNLCTFKSLNNYFLTFDYDFDSNSITYVASRTGSVSIPFYALGTNNCYIYNVLSDPILGINFYAMVKNKPILNYPIYVRDGELALSGDVKFSNTVGSGSGGDSNINDEITDNIEDSSELPQVDDSAPSDPTNIPSWLQKILTGLKTFNKNMLGIGRTIIGKLKDIFDKLKDFVDTWIITFDDGINAIISAINGLKDGTTQEEAKQAWVDGYNDFALKPAIDIVSGWGSGFHSSIDSADALTDYSYEIPMPPIGIPNLTTGQTDMVYLFGRSITIDLNWYVQPNFFGKSPRDYLTEFVIPWLILSFVVSLYFKLPGMLGGASDNMTMVKDLTTNNINSGKVGTYGGILSQTKIEPL